MPILRFAVRELAFIAVFASLWIAAQTVLGPLVGRFSLGPISMHGTVNHVIGWFAMVLTASLLGKFGRVSMMTLVAALGTRAARVSALEGALVGSGYVLAGLLFDALYFSLALNRFQGNKRKICIILIAAVTGVASLIPYLVFRFYALGPMAFTILLPSYLFSAGKNVFFSSVGAYLGVVTLPRLSQTSGLARSS